MKVFLLITIYVLSFNNAKSQESIDSLLTVLKTEVKKKPLYDHEKERQLNDLKRTLANTPKNSIAVQYALLDQLYEGYKNYKFDSAHVYITKLLKASNSLNDLSQHYESEIKLGLIQLSWGMYKETFECIAELERHNLAGSTKANFYALKYRALQNLATYNTDEFYSTGNQRESIKVLDSAVRLNKPGTYQYNKYAAQLFTFQGKKNKAANLLKQLVDMDTIGYQQRAMAAHDLSFLVSYPERKRLIILAAIFDIRSSTNQTLAAFTLGDILFKEGHLDDAQLFLTLALNQAKFYGSRLHEKEALIILDQVAAKQQLNSANSKNRVLMVMIGLVITALIGLAFVSFFVYSRLKKVRIREAVVQEKYQHLDSINKKLLEDTHIKEEYIGYFFNIISGYILKLEKIKRNTERKLKAGNYDEVLQLAKEIDIKKERHNLFFTFDHIFIKLFPNFINSFNALLKPEDQLWPKDNEILNTNLRIFALMRLGVWDSQTIANILETSISTIYTYKNRIKSKALVDGSDFYKVMMDIKFGEQVI